MRLCILLFVGLSGCSDGDKGSTLDTALTCAAAKDTGTDAYQEIHDACAAFAGNLLTSVYTYWGRCDIDDDDNNEEYYNYPEACVSAYYSSLTDECTAAILCSNDSAAALTTLTEACGYGHYLIHEQPEDYNDYCGLWNYASPTDECAGAPINDGYTFTQSILFWCPCLLTGDYGPNPNYDNTVTCL